ELAGVIETAGIGHGPAEFGKVAAGASRLSGGGNLRIDEQVATEIDQRLVFYRARWRAAIVTFNDGKARLVAALSTRRPGLFEREQRACGKRGQSQRSLSDYHSHDPRWFHGPWRLEKAHCGLDRKSVV